MIKYDRPLDIYRAMSKPNFLLVEHGGARKQFTFEVLKKKGVNIFLVCTVVPPWLKTLLPEGNIFVTDTYNSVKLLSDTVSFFEAKKMKIDAIGTFYEHTVVQTADIAKALNLEGIDPGAARRSSHNKLLMRIVCRNAKIPAPAFEVVRGLELRRFIQTIKKIGLPCVIKPIFGAESYGTVKIEKYSDLMSAVNEIKLNTSSDKKEVFKNFTETFLVEKYLQGPVVSVDGLVQHKRVMVAGMVEFVMGPEPRFTQEANYIPTRFDNSVCVSCIDMAKRVIHTLGFDNCGFHCELRITPEGPVLIEIAARLPGGPLQPGYQKAYGVDLTSALVDIWLGRKVNLKPNLKNYILQKAVFPRKNGKIINVKGLRKIKKIKGIWDFSKISNKGEIVVTYPDIPKPFYYYAAAAQNPDLLDLLSNKIESTVRFEIF